MFGRDKKEKLIQTLLRNFNFNKVTENATAIFRFKWACPTFNFNVFF